ALITRGKLYNRQIQKAIDGLLSQIREDGSVLGVSAGTAIMHDAVGYKQVPNKRLQGWGQGLALAFLAQLLKRDQ
ncbi:MAG TPA: glycoside hydrolase family 88 protein, partial [Niallia sp.]|nr:glycoside hydrolase family 88 protein [Niallia sp.]